MTDLLSETDLARVPLPADVVGFGFAEMRYLLSLHETESSAMTARSLGLDEVAPDAEWVGAAGISSLLARGLVAADRDRAVSRGEAALLEVLFSRGHRWSGVGFRDVDDGEGDMLVVIEGPGAVGLLQPRPFGTWFVSLSADPAHVADPSDLVAASILEARELHPGVGFAIETRTLEGLVGRRYARPAPDGWLVSDTLQGKQHRRGLTDTAAVVRATLTGVGDLGE